MSINNHVVLIQESPNLLVSQSPNLLLSPSVLMLGGLGIFLALISIGDLNKKKDKLANSYWGGKGEIARARKKAKKQIAKPTRNSACLYINCDRDIRQRLDRQWAKKNWLNPVPYKKR